MSANITAVFPFPMGITELIPFPELEYEGVIDGNIDKVGEKGECSVEK